MPQAAKDGRSVFEVAGRAGARWSATDEPPTVACHERPNAPEWARPQGCACGRTSRRSWTVGFMVSRWIKPSTPGVKKKSRCIKKKSIRGQLTSIGFSCVCVSSSPFRDRWRRGSYALDGTAEPAAVVMPACEGRGPRADAIQGGGATGSRFRRTIASTRKAASALPATAAATQTSGDSHMLGAREGAASGPTVSRSPSS